VRLRAEPDGDDVVVRIDDEGPGVASDELEAIFQPFHHSPQSGGAGLGLAIARGFVAANGGRLWVESAPGGGASFVLVLPAEQPAPVPS
jgi:signal transduction histidine kinase